MLGLQPPGAAQGAADWEGTASRRPLTPLGSPRQARAVPRKLDAERIIETSAVLGRRVAERFPDSSLAKVAHELHAVAEEAAAISNWLARPLWWVRAGVVMASALLIALLCVAASRIRLEVPFGTAQEVVPFLESLVNDGVFIGIGIYFLVGVELRIKRRRAAQALHVLRSLAHIVDMHQLTKDPERLRRPGRDTQSSPEREMTPFELTRYLDYCCEILSLVSKVAAVYVQHFDDAVTVSAASSVETLTVGLSRKIWQKIMLLDRLEGPAQVLGE